MLIFISGSINSGKTTTAYALADRIGAVSINVDDLNDSIPDFDLATDLDKSMDLAIEAINKGLAQGRDVVANYVVRQKDFDGRISHDNKAWAKTIPVCEDPDGFGSFCGVRGHGNARAEPLHDHVIDVFWFPRPVPPR